MNSVWLTSPFVQFDTENLIYNETLCSEAHFINKFSRDKYKTEQQNPSANNDRQGNVLSAYSSKSNLLAKTPKQVEEIEENFTFTVNTRRETANSVITGLLKIDSKISLKKTEPRSTLSETNLHSREDSWARGCETAGSRTIEGDPLLSCPFELVQIYPGNKENISDLDRTFSDVSREGSSMICFPKEKQKSSKTAAFEKDAPSLLKLKRGYGDSGKNEPPSSTRRSQKSLKQASVLNAPRYNESKPVDLEKKSESLQTDTGQDVSSSSSFDDFEKSTKGQKRLKESSRRQLKKTKKLTNCLEHETVPVAGVESEKSLTADLAKEDRNGEVIPSLEASVCNADMFDDYSMKSREGRAKKSACVPSTIIDISGADWFTGDIAVIVASEKTSNPAIRGTEDNLRAVAGRREQGTNILNEMETMRATDTRNRGNQIVEGRIVEYADDDASSGKEEAKFGVDYGDIKICNLLLIIHKQLYINFQKMENIWIQLQDTSSIDSVRSAVPMRLLVRIISRCKSYIHDSRDTYTAESKIAKTLLSLVIDLAKAVDQNKLVVEKQEQQIDSILLKLYQEKNLYRKRIMINEVVSFWDHGLREICDIMQDILDRLKIVIVETDEKEDVRNPRSRRKDVYAEWRDLKLNLASRGSNIEMQMPAAPTKHNPMRQPKSKTSMKSLNTPRSREVEKTGEVVPMKIAERRNNENVSLHRYNTTRHPKSKPSTKSLNIQRIRDAEKLLDAAPYKIVERKPMDNARCHERGRLLKKLQSVNFEQWKPMSRQKSRVANNQQPVWRPGGVVKLPSSSSATTLTQKSRPLLPQASEKANQPTEHIKEHLKHGRPGEPKKKIGAETCPAKCRAHNLANDSCKQLSRKCALYPEATVKCKLKSRPLKVCFKQDSESSCRSESSSPERVSQKKNSKEAKVLKVLEEIIKSTPQKDKKLANKSLVGDRDIETSSTEPVNPVSIEEEAEISQEEPTRDVDPNQALASRSKDVGTFRETPQSVQKIPECPLSSITDIKNRSIGSKLDIQLENSEAKNSFSCTNCTADLEPSSDYTSETESSKNYHGIVNFEPSSSDRKLQEDDEDDARKNLTIVKERRSKNPSSVNEEKSENSIDIDEEILENLISINEEKSKNPSDVNEEILENLSSINEERSQIPAEINEEILNDLSSINEETSKNPSTINEEKSKTHSYINEIRSKNSSDLNEEILKNLSSINEERSQNPAEINEEILNDLSSINEETSKNPSTINEEKSKTHSYINEIRSKNPSDSNEEILKNLSPINENRSQNLTEINKEISKNPSLINNERSKNPSSVNEEKSKSPSINEEKSKNPSSINEEKSKQPSSIKEEKSRHPSSINETASSTNSHTTSLTILKEFLRDQGVDVNLLNRAEQCMREKRKYRSCSKTKSVSLADVGECDKQRDKRREPSAQSCRETEILEKIMKICERRLVASENGRKQSNENSKENAELPEKKNASTSTETKNADACSETIPLKTETKSVQIIVKKDTSLMKKQEKETIETQTEITSKKQEKETIETQTEIISKKQEKETIETQTEIISIRHTATDCCQETVESTTKVESNDASTMTKSTALKDSVTETVQVSYVSKTTATERPHSTENIQDRSRQSATNLLEIWSKMSVKGDQRLTGYRLNKPGNSSEKLPSTCDQDGGKPDFRESDSSTSSCSLQQLPPCSLNCDCNATMDREFDYFDGMIPWETIATLESATNRARNMYNAIYSYQQHLESKQREETGRKLANTEKCNSERRERKNLSMIDSIVVEGSYHSCKYEISSRPEVASSNDESECEYSRSASTSIANVSRNEKNVSDAVDVGISKKSSSSAVLRDVGSLMELLIQKMDDAKIGEMDFVQAVASRTCSEIRVEISRTETGKTGNTITSFTRQSVLMLVYGVVCSIVFWCLQFTITCDVVA